MAHDRDEWRTPWRVAEVPSDPTAASTTTPDLEGQPTGSDASAAPTAAAATGAVGAATAGPGATAPIHRFPQPPPAGWDPTAAGPGSPPGSVRPPDTTGTHEAPRAPRRGRTLLAVVVASLVSALIGGAVVAAVVASGTDAPLVGGDTSQAPSISVNGDAGGMVPTVAEAVLPSVVSIDVPAPAGALGAQGGRAALGSGVVYRSDGFILTNAHVVGDADEVTVRLASGDILSAQVVGTDPLNDLAVLEADLEDGRTLPAINLREDDELVVGETVIAIGSPFGLDGSVTSGIVSGLNRDLTVGEEGGAGLTIPAVIQTDAAINPGNSGGALVDVAGRLIGINTAILTRTGGNQGIGFAVPVGQAISSADQIIDQGFVRHPLLGVSGLDVSPELADEFGLDAPRGAVVDSVQPDTGAEAAGVEPGDIITQVDGEALATMSQLVSEVRSRTPGEVIVLTIVRDGRELELEVELSERPRD